VQNGTQTNMAARTAAPNLCRQGDGGCDHHPPLLPHKPAHSGAVAIDRETAKQSYDLRSTIYEVDELMQHAEAKLQSAYAYKQAEG
jgi:hypothetical protein